MAAQHRLLDLLTSVLEIMNKELMEHSKRTAFMMIYLAKKQQMDEIQTRKMFLNCYFHDIGSFKSNDNDNLMKFIIKKPLEHAKSGYLFLKYNSPLKNDARPILYHHAYYARGIIDQDHILGLKIHILDRLDVLINNNYPLDKIIKMLNDNSGKMFSPRDVLDVIFLLQNTDLYQNVINKKYADYVKKYMYSLNFSDGILLEFIEMLVATFELHNPDTMFHTTSTAIIARELAIKEGLPKEKCIEIYMAGLFHDIGKVKIPQKILDKPGKLNKSEMELVKMHVTYTKEIIENFVNPEIVNIAYSHHEKLDGSGYPRSLTRKDLSISCKILAIADIISALYSKRSYKDEFTTEEVFNIIDEMVANDKIDFMLVRTFKQYYIEIMDVVNKRTTVLQKKVDASKKEKEEIEKINFLVK